MAVNREELEALSHRTRWLFAHHRHEAVAITDALLTRLFQGKKDQLAEQMLHIIVNTLRDFWNQPSNESQLNDDLAELKRLRDKEAEETS